jgi:sugar/nucleoside kinase (ribokinase family)
MGILTVGTVAFDTIETPLGKAENVVGGAALYAGLSASYFSKEVNIVSVIGGDYDQATLELMKSRGMNLDGLQVKQGEKSFFWAGKYHDNMNARDTLATDLNVLADFDPQLPASYTDDEYILLGNLTPDVQIQVLEQLTSKPKLVVLDTMNFWMDIAMDRLKEAISKIDVLTINDEEARQLSGEYSLVKGAHKILEMGPKALIVKKGEHGALLFQGDKMFFAPALPLAEVFDPTGAGDTFAGGFIGYIAKTGDTSFEGMKKAIIHGSAMASFCVEKFSIERLKNLTQEEIADRVDTFRELVRF